MHIEDYTGIMWKFKSCKSGIGSFYWLIVPNITRESKSLKWNIYHSGETSWKTYSCLSFLQLSLSRLRRSPRTISPENFKELYTKVWNFLNPIQNIKLCNTMGKVIFHVRIYDLKKALFLLQDNCQKNDSFMQSR